MRKESTSRKTISTFSIALILLLVFQQMASKAGDIIAQLFNYSRIDVNNTFAYISVHHIVQMLIAFVAIYIVYKVIHLEFDLKWKFSKIGIKYAAIFTAVILVYVIATYIIGYGIHSIVRYNYPLTPTNVFGSLGFQLLLSGPSEEILFRALPITVLSYVVDRNEDKRTLVPIICAALLFSLAHIEWTLLPFSLAINWFQLVYAFILGIAYGVTYEKSKSIFYPMIMHSMSNVLTVGVGYLLMTFYR